MHYRRTAILWANESLENKGYIINGPFEVVREMPWSKVDRIPTSKGLIYFKQMAQPFSIEPRLLQYLSEHISANVPVVIDSDKTLRCFLMLDSGTPLRTSLNMHFDLPLYIRAINLYAAMQIEAIQHIDALLGLRIQDWRLEKLPALYQGLISQDDILKSDGLNAAEIGTLHVLTPKFSELCERLSQYRIPETIEHGDFHDNNILFNNDDFTINDWGDTSLSHPFFSIAGCLNSVGRNHKIKASDNRYQEILNAFLINWQQFGSQDKLMEAFLLAQNLRLFQFALSFSRVKMCPGMERYTQYKGYMAEALREFIALNLK